MKKIILFLSLFFAYNYAFSVTVIIKPLLQARKKLIDENPSNLIQGDFIIIDVNDNPTIKDIKSELSRQINAEETSGINYFDYIQRKDGIEHFTLQDNDLVDPKQFLRVYQGAKTDGLKVNVLENGITKPIKLSALETRDSFSQAGALTALFLKERLIKHLGQEGLQAKDVTLAINEIVKKDEDILSVNDLKTTNQIVINIIPMAAPVIMKSEAQEMAETIQALLNKLDDQNERPNLFSELESTITSAMGYKVSLEKVIETYAALASMPNSKIKDNSQDPIKLLENAMLWLRVNNPNFIKAFSSNAKINYPIQAIADYFLAMAHILKDQTIPLPTEKFFNLKNNSLKKSIDFIELYNQKMAPATFATLIEKYLNLHK